jgi:hypothetical protein
LAGFNPRSNVSNPDIEFIFILLSKLKQMIDVKNLNESSVIFSAIMRVAAEKLLVSIL